MRWTSIAYHFIGVAVLTGCLGGVSSPGLPQSTTPMARPVHGIPAPASAKHGIYVGLISAQGDIVLGYPLNERENGGPICSVATPSVADVAVDSKGNLMAATWSANEVVVFQGPGMCGQTMLGTLETNGLTAAVASSDAKHGEIVVGIGYSNTPSGIPEIALCTLAGGCTTYLTYSGMFGLQGVALAKNGDCWASGFGSSAMLVYFPHCAGSGQLASGFKNRYPGGLDIDKDGNILSVDGTQGFWVYQGCNPTCTLVGGPFASEGSSYTGHLNKNSTRFAAADLQYGQIDVYKYHPNKITYEYSFNNGISGSDKQITGAAYNPRSKE